MIFEGSRYEFTDVEFFPASDGTQRQTICVTADPQPTLQFSYAIYYCKDGDRIDLLAAQFLNDSELWWVIAEVNPQWIYYDRLPPGLALRIPNGIPSS